MKLNLKGSAEFFNIKKLGIVYFISLIVCAALRTYHLIYVIEPETGFYKSGNFTVTLFYAVLAFACVFCMAGAYLARETVDFSAETVSGKPVLGIISLLVSFSFFLDVGYCFTMLGEETQAYTYSNDTMFSVMMRSGSLPRKAEMLCAVFASVYFLILGFLILTKKYKGQLKLISLFSVFWGVARLITFFVKQISFVRVSDILLEIAATSLVTLFLFSLCKCLSGVYSDGAQWGVIGLGLPASLCCLTIQIPRIIAALIDNKNYGNEDYTAILYSNDFVINYVQIFIGVLVMAIFAIFMNTTVPQKKND